MRIVRGNDEPWLAIKDACAESGAINQSWGALNALDFDEKNTVTLSYGIQGSSILYRPLPIPPSRYCDEIKQLRGLATRNI